jgi:hypothetical protein
MKLTSCLALTACCGSIAPPIHAEVLHSEPVQDLRSAARSNGGSDMLEVEFTALGREFRLELTPNRRLEALRRHLGVSSGVEAYRGRLKEAATSWARIVTTPTGLAGIIFDGNSLYGLEAPFDSGSRAEAAVMFRLDDVRLDPDALSCGTHEHSNLRDGAVLLDTLAQQSPPMLAQSGAAFELEIGVIADFEFAESFGENAETAMLARFNTIDGIFSEQLGVQMTVTGRQVFAAEPDPFTATAASDLLDQLAVYRGNTPEQDARGLTYLFTGRDLDGSTAGIAYVGAVCSRRGQFDPLGRSFGVGLSESSRGLIVDSLIAAHEVGHSFGAPHDAETGSSCESTAPLYLMAPTINGSDRFSACSLDEMNVQLAAADCLIPIGQADMTVSAEQPDRVVALGERFDHGTAVLNLGAETATGVRFELTLPNGLELDSAWTQDGCMLIDSILSCEVGAIAGGAVVTVRPMLAAVAVGPAALHARVSADFDANTANDAQTAEVTVLPLVDLELNGDSGQMRVDQAQELSVSIANRSDTTASALELGITATSGLLFEQAELAGSPCALIDRNASCTLDALAPGAEAIARIVVSATRAGSQSLSLQLGSYEADTNDSDNVLRLDIDVRSVPTASAGSGGGGSSLSLLAICAVLGSVRWAVRLRRRQASLRY